MLRLLAYGSVGVRVYRVLKSFMEFYEVFDLGRAL